jgi:predicted anti-sigma-YlaC factor YlaD
MKCDLPIELLSGYLDGELDGEQTRMVEEHMKACKVCRKELEDLKKLDGYVRSVEVEEPSREFLFTVNRRVIDRIKKKRRVSFFRFAPVLVPVAVAALVLIVLVRSPEPTQFVDIDHLVYFVEPETRYTETTVEVPAVDGRSVPVEKSAERVRAPVIMKDEATEELTAAGAPAPSAPEPVMKKAAVGSEYRREAELSEDADITDIEGLFYQYELPKGQVVRAIVDTTGRVVKVATGNTIIPERDTVLENRLQGQQLAPDRFKGKRVQFYLDFINEAPEETSEPCTE